MKIRTGALFIFIFALILSACNSQASVKETATTVKDTDHEQVVVYTTLYPFKAFTEAIGGDLVKVESIYPAGADAHSFEPSSKTMIDIAESDLFIYNGAGMEAFADAAVDTMKDESVAILEATKEIDLLSGQSVHHHHDEEDDAHSHEDHAETEHSNDAEDVEHGHDAQHEDAHDHEDVDVKHEHDEEQRHTDKTDAHDHTHGDVDPHAWLDPIRAIEMAEQIKNELIALRPEHKASFEEAFQSLQADLTELDEDFQEMLSTKEDRAILVSHAAFGYWQDRYDIDQISVSGLSPSQEPSQQQLLDIIAEAEHHDIKHVIFEQNVTPRVAKMVQEEIGGEALTLHNLSVLSDEDIQNDEDYFSLMRHNIDVLDQAMN
ncbi:zinc ABC transporter solute-binding protein [Bacillaceae bacterium SIJ1]|uniref:metal ABC transporter solute-binding protein, Zn/Mn family n=1 Tax=Litoribacterium kuwaitense TaxID=1398745 RepID=UPI0013EB8560|nr:zinc ABC transporter substrate-binding protein [Litoribacterium kuwaitense]NGP46043.1 zinc ABC transporter solute-binding protein [Litoribacterium kuwaitense]